MSFYPVPMQLNLPLPPSFIQAALLANQRVSLPQGMRMMLSLAIGAPLRVKVNGTHPATSRPLSEKVVHALAAWQYREAIFNGDPLPDPSTVGYLTATSIGQLSIFAAVMQARVGPDAIDDATEQNKKYAATLATQSLRNLRITLGLPTFDYADDFLTVAIMHAQHLVLSSRPANPFVTLPHEPRTGLIVDALAFLHSTILDQPATNKQVPPPRLDFYPDGRPLTHAEAIIRDITDRCVMLQTGKRTPFYLARTCTAVNPEYNGQWDGPELSLHGRLTVPSRPRKPSTQRHPWSKHNPGTDTGVMSGLCAGPTLASQQSGQLAKLLRYCQAHDPEGFASSFRAPFTPEVLFSRLDRPKQPIAKGYSPRTEPVLDAMVWETPWVDSIKGVLSLPSAERAFRHYFHAQVIAPALWLMAGGLKISIVDCNTDLLTVLTDLVMTQGRITTKTHYDTFLKSRDTASHESLAHTFVKTLKGESRRRAEWILATTSQTDNFCDAHGLTDPTLLSHGVTLPPPA